MAELYGLLTDLDRCVGCYACELACKQEHKLPVGIRWLTVVTLGPKKVEGKLRAEYVPLTQLGCTLCEHRTSKKLKPSCVEACPVEALKFCNTREMISALNSGKRYQISGLKNAEKIPAFG